MIESNRLLRASSRLAVCVLLGLLAGCSSQSTTDPNSGGGSGGAPASGGLAGAIGGSNSGGSNSGGSNSGGSNNGGSNNGGSNNGGSNNGGSNSAGSNSAGSNSAGSNSAGSNSAGSNSGGSNSAGSAGSGGSSAGSAGGGAAGSNAGNGGAAGSAGTAGSSNPNQVDVYLLAGQSNATGQGYTKNLPSGFMVDTRVQLYHSSEIISGASANTWIPLRHASEAADSCGDRFGPELGFGNAIQGFYPGRPIAIIKHAKSSTNLVSQWAPGSSASDTSHFGPEFKTFAATVEGGLKALRDKGKVPVIVGMLWQQGENDADLGGTASADYGKNLKALITRVRTQWSAPDMLFVYGYVYPKSNYGTGRDQVRAAEKNVDQDSGNALATPRAFVVQTDGLELRADDPNSCYKSDLIHFGSAGQLELGKRMAMKVHDKLSLVP